MADQYFLLLMISDETIRVYDGTASLQKGTFRICSVSKTATVQQIVVRLLNPI